MINEIVFSVCVFCCGFLAKDRDLALRKWEHWHIAEREQAFSRHGCAKKAGVKRDEDK